VLAAYVASGAPAAASAVTDRAIVAKRVDFMSMPFYKPLIFQAAL
jgi:hypothetical protein